MLKRVVIILFIFSIIKIILMVLTIRFMKVRPMTEEEKIEFDKEENDRFFED